MYRMLLGFRSRCTTWVGVGETLERGGGISPTLTCLQEVLPHPLAVEVVNSLGDGEEHSTGLSLREKLLPKDLVQQLPSLHQLRHQVHVPAFIIHLAERGNLSVWWLGKGGGGRL